MNILIQGSGGTIGDTFLSSHPLVNRQEREVKVFAAIPKKLNESIKDLYSRQKFLQGVFELESIQEDSFLEFCRKEDFTPVLFLKSWDFYRRIKYCLLSTWFDKPNDPTIPSNSIIVQVTSTNNFNRPRIPYLEKYIQYIFDAGYFPAIIGTKKDEEYFNKIYPSIKEKIPEDFWRFGKDTLLQTMSNIDISQGVFAFSSWSSIYGALCRKPVLELWNNEQWLFYNQTVKYLLGNPYNLFQTLYSMEPQYNYFSSSFSNIRSIEPFSIWG